MNTRQQPQLKIRLPPDLKAAIEESAQQNFRSVNNEVVKRLFDSLQTENAPTAANG